jgi:hypothetical protein
MKVLEWMLFALAVQLSAGVVVMINVVLSRLNESEASSTGGGE